MALVALSLTDPEDPYQQWLRSQAEAAARRNDLTVDASFCARAAALQREQVERWLADDPKPRVLAAMPVGPRGASRLAQLAADAGVHLILLDHGREDISALAGWFPAISVSQLATDETAVGRLQGELTAALAPEGGRVLVLEDVAGPTAQARTHGLLTALSAAGVELERVQGGPTALDGAATTSEWMRARPQAKRQLDAIVCNNDRVALGAWLALQELPQDLASPGPRHTPIVGCDGTPDFGQAMVHSGRLAATVVLPDLGTAAMEWAGLLRSGQRPPALQLLQPSPCPERRGHHARATRPGAPAIASARRRTDPVRRVLPGAD